MAKNHRVELRLNDDDYQLLQERAGHHRTTMTKAVESLLHLAVPVRLDGVYEVGVMGRRRFSVRFSNGMTVHGFLWSRGRQLLPPMYRTDNGYRRTVDGTLAFWHSLRELCVAQLEADDQDHQGGARNRERELERAL